MSAKSKKPLMTFKNARTDEQIEIMEKAQKDGVCPFCRTNVERYHTKPIHKEDEYWLLTENMSPYKGSKHHFLLIYSREHVESIEEVSPEAFGELHRWISFLKEQYQLKGGSFLIRTGDSKYNGGSVNHLHAHFIVGDGDNPEHEPVRVKVG